MPTETSTPPGTDGESDASPDSLPRELISRITRFEILVAAVIAAVMAVLVVIEPDILEAPFENERTLLFTVGGTAIAAIAYVGMLWLRVPAVVRVIVLVVPFAMVNWWLLSPYFTDDVVDEDFSTSIAAQLPDADEPAAPAAPEIDGGAASPETEAPALAESADEEPAVEEQPTPEDPTEEQPSQPTGPVLVGAGQFVGLAGHEGTGDAGIFQNPGGPFVLRFENFDIENGPDLEVYLVPGSDQTSVAEGSIHLGALKGNIGDQTYELPAGIELGAGSYTALVWCEAFSVEFVGATIAT